MNTTDIIQLLTENALKSYREDIHPDPFAASAVHIIVAAEAAKYSADSADAAAFVAVSSMVDLSIYSAKQAVSATKAHDAMKNYHANEHETAADLKTIVPAFEEIIEKMTTVSFASQADDIYDSTFGSSDSENYRLARHAARAMYTHAYASLRVAYTHAIAVAARYPQGDARQAAFKTAMAQRLSADLLHEPIEPSFFMQILCSDAMKIFGALLLVAGLAVLAIGICGLAMAPFGAMLLSAISINSASLTAAGAVMTASSGALFTGRFFTAKKWQDDNEKSHQAVNAHNIDHTPEPTK